MKSVITLAIESSCDETSVAVVRDGRQVLSNIISTQMDEHKKFGGVVPEVASRRHIENIQGVVQESLDEAGVKFSDIDIVGVTYGAGLVGALLVGLSTAKAISFALGVPLVGVNHIEGHICANFIAHKELEPPFACLVVSGGHTHMVEVRGYGDYNVLGMTRDDAAGEAFDKLARAIGLGYPGGSKIDRAAKLGDKEAIDFPRAYLEKGSYDFSFSGLKSAALNYLNSKKMKKEEISIEDVSASYQEAIVDVLAERSIRACIEKGYKTLAIAGGVAANSRLRERLEGDAKAHGIQVKYPPIELCTDNAAMIGCAAYYDYIGGRVSSLDLNAVPGLRIGERE